jgi:tRNA-(ms[2]io[6]A)-hydroxylase
VEQLAQGSPPTLHISDDTKWGRLELLWKTPIEWAQNAIKDIDSFLIDHAACERKASSLAMSFVVKYRDKPRLVRAMTELALEELEHFKLVLEVLESRGLFLGGDTPDSYVGQLLSFCRNDNNSRLLDRLLISGIIEARGCERFSLISRALGAETLLGKFYEKLSRAEAKHQLLFVQLACEYFSTAMVSERLLELSLKEAEIARNLEWKSQLH